jgi:hypothetical protein
VGLLSCRGQTSSVFLNQLLPENFIFNSAFFTDNTLLCQSTKSSNCDNPYFLYLTVLYIMLPLKLQFTFLRPTNLSGGYHIVVLGHKQVTTDKHAEEK